MAPAPSAGGRGARGGPAGPVGRPSGSRAAAAAARGGGGGGGRRAPPPGPAGDVGLEMAAGPLGMIERLKAQYGPLVGFRAAGEPVVLVASPGAARRVLLEGREDFVKTGTAFFPGSKLTGNGLLVSDGEEWARQRKLSNPAFRRAAVAAYAEAMCALTQEMLRERWGGGGRRDVYRDFNDLTLSIVSTSLFGSSVSGPAAERVNTSIGEAMAYLAGSASLGVLPSWLPTPENIQFQRAVDRLDEAVYGIIRERRRALEDLIGDECEGEGSEQDLLDRLMGARGEHGEGMSDSALRDELMTLMVAGQETSAILLAWTCAFLAQHPRVARRASAEVDAVLKGRPPTGSDCPRLPYTEACVLESMRLMPPAYMVGRCAHHRDVTLDGREFPRGTTFLVSPYLIHRDPAHWRQARTFQPGRWMNLLPGSTPQATALAHNALKGLGPSDAYFPFGAGPRNCIGTGFALVEAVLVVAAVLQKFDLRLPPGQGFPEPEALLTLRPSSFQLDLVERAVPPPVTTSRREEACSAAAGSHPVLEAAQS